MTIFTYKIGEIFKNTNRSVVFSLLVFFLYEIQWFL